MPGNVLLQIRHLCCYCSLWQYDSDTWLSESAGKTTQGLTVKPKGVTLEDGKRASEFHCPVVHSTVHKVPLLPEWIMSSWPEGKLLLMGSGSNAGASLAWHSHLPSWWGALLRGWRGQNNNNKTTFIQVWVTQAALSSHGLLTSGLGTPNDTLLLLRVELPFPRSLCTLAGSPAKATVPQESWPQAGWWEGQQGWGWVCPLTKPPPCGGRHCNIPGPFMQSWGGEIMMEVGEETGWVSSSSTLTLLLGCVMQLLITRGSGCKCDPCAMHE